MMMREIHMSVRIVDIEYNKERKKELVISNL